MRIFSRKSFIFGKGENEVTVRNQEIADVPDYVADTKLFKLAVADGSIEVLSSKAEEKLVEKNGTAKKTKEKDESSTEE